MMRRSEIGETIGCYATRSYQINNRGREKVQLANLKSFRSLLTSQRFPLYNGVAYDGPFAG